MHRKFPEIINSLKNKFTLKYLKQKNILLNIYSIIFSLTIFVLAIITTQDAQSRQYLNHIEESAVSSLYLEELSRFQKEITVQRGDSFASIFQGLGISHDHATDIISNISPHFNPRHLQPGKKIRMILLTDSKKQTPVIELLRMETSPQQEIRISYKDNSYESRIVPVKTITIRKAVTGTIQNSLYSDAVAAGIPETSVMELFHLYSYDIDFQRDIYRDDIFQVMYENVVNTDRDIVTRGRIIYAELDLRGRNFPLYRFTDDSGKTDFYDDKGINVRKTLLRTPVMGGRISSGFGRRDHPIFGYSQQHQGLDFAAPKNTPVIASGSGTVELAGWHGGYGNCIIIRHANQYKTLYAHLNSFANNVRRGSTVRQGQIIGYVGTTGVSTGYHLHYEVIFRNARINPSTLRTPPEKKLNEEELLRFFEEKEIIDIDFKAISG